MTDIIGMSFIPIYICTRWSDLYGSSCPYCWWFGEGSDSESQSAWELPSSWSTNGVEFGFFQPSGECFSNWQSVLLTGWQGDARRQWESWKTVQCEGFSRPYCGKLPRLNRWHHLGTSWDKWGSTCGGHHSISRGAETGGMRMHPLRARVSLRVRVPLRVRAPSSSHKRQQCQGSVSYQEEPHVLMLMYCLWKLGSRGWVQWWGSLTTARDRNGQGFAPVRLRLPPHVRVFILERMVNSHTLIYHALYTVLCIFLL